MRGLGSTMGHYGAHVEFARINIEPTILRKKIEDVRETGATLLCDDTGPALLPASQSPEVLVQPI